MTTRREQILAGIAAIATGVPGILPDSITRERASPVMASDCPALDISPDSDPEPTPLGAGIDRYDLVIAARIWTVGDPAYSQADAYAAALHALIMGNASLSAIAAIIPGATDFAKDDADQTISRVTVRYRAIYVVERARPSEGPGVSIDQCSDPDALHISMRLGEFSDEPTRAAARANLGLQVIDLGEYH